MKPNNYPKKHIPFTTECPFCEKEYGVTYNTIYVTSVKSYENKYYHNSCGEAWSESN